MTQRREIWLLHLRLMKLVFGRGAHHPDRYDRWCDSIHKRGRKVQAIRHLCSRVYGHEGLHRCPCGERW